MQYTDTMKYARGLCVSGIIDEFRIKKDKATSMLADIQRSLSEWKTVARSLGILQKEIDRMESAFVT
jgi:hypothetical protein